MITIVHGVYNRNILKSRQIGRLKQEKATEEHV